MLLNTNVFNARLYKFMFLYTNVYCRNYSIYECSLFRLGTMGNCVSPQNRADTARNEPFLQSTPLNQQNRSVKKPSSADPRQIPTPRMYHVNVSNGYPQAQEQPQNTCLVALYAYESRSDGDLSFEKGDVMYLLDGSNSDWWYVRKEKTGSTGYVPRNFVARFRTLESEE